MTTDKFLIYDWETLSTKQNSIVLSLGAIIIDSNKTYTEISDFVDGENALYLKFNVSEQREAGRHISKSTLEWWKSQGESAKIVLTPSSKDVSYKIIPTELNKFFKRNDFSGSKFHAYSRGHFDYLILQDICDELKETCPVLFWNSRDIRTFVDVMIGSNRGKVPNFKPKENIVLHNSLHDCINDFFQMQECYKIAYDDN
jgi:hypothetical protein